MRPRSSGACLGRAASRLRGRATTTASPTRRTASARATRSCSTASGSAIAGAPRTRRRCTLTYGALDRRARALAATLRSEHPRAAPGRGRRGHRAAPARGRGAHDQPALPRRLLRAARDRLAARARRAILEVLAPALVARGDERGGGGGAGRGRRRLAGAAARRDRTASRSAFAARAPAVGPRAACGPGALGAALPAVIFSTSGSTGRPKPIAWSAATLGRVGVTTAFSAPASEPLLLWTAPRSVTGTIFLLSSLKFGGATVLVDHYERAARVGAAARRDLPCGAFCSSAQPWPSCCGAEPPSAGFRPPACSRPCIPSCTAGRRSHPSSCGGRCASSRTRPSRRAG